MWNSGDNSYESNKACHLAIELVHPCSIRSDACNRNNRIFPVLTAFIAKEMQNSHECSTIFSPAITRSPYSLTYTTRPPRCFILAYSCAFLLPLLLPLCPPSQH